MMQSSMDHNVDCNKIPFEGLCFFSGIFNFFSKNKQINKQKNTHKKKNKQTNKNKTKQKNTSRSLDR